MWIFPTCRLTWKTNFKHIQLCFVMSNSMLTTRQTCNIYGSIMLGINWFNLTLNVHFQFFPEKKRLNYLFSLNFIFVIKSWNNFVKMIWQIINNNPKNKWIMTILQFMCTSTNFLFALIFMFSLNFVKIIWKDLLKDNNPLVNHDCVTVYFIINLSLNMKY